MTVATATNAIMAAEAKRALPRALMGGTMAMRAAATAYLPREVAELHDDYEIRLARTFLFNGYGKTVRDMTGKVLGRPITFGDDAPPEIADPDTGWQLNVDGTGRDINSFARDVFMDAFDGVSYILTDMDGPVDGTITKRDEKDMGRRPYWVHIKACQALGIKSANIGGKQVLTQFRYRDDQCEDGPDGYSEKVVPQVRVFTRTDTGVMWQLYRQREAANGTIAGEWYEYEAGTTTLTEIAVAPVYTGRTGYFMGEPPLADMAEVNQAHWQSQSDQRNILHIARVPILFGSGIPEDGKPLEIGAKRMVVASDPAARLGYVEHSGAAIGAGREDLKDLEYQMQVMGLELLTPKPGAQSATGAVIDDARANAPLSVMAQGLEDALENALQFMADFANLPTGGSIEINKDWAVGLSAADAATILAAKGAGVISTATALRELQRRGIVSADLDADEEVIAAMNDAYMADDTLPGDTLAGDTLSGDTLPGGATV